MRHEDDDEQEPIWEVLPRALAPASDPQDPYAAGYDGNVFDSETEAEQAIPGLRAVGEEYDHEWVVRAY